MLDALRQQGIAGRRAVGHPQPDIHRLTLLCHWLPSGFKRLLVHVCGEDITETRGLPLPLRQGNMVSDRVGGDDPGASADLSIFPQPERKTQVSAALYASLPIAVSPTSLPGTPSSSPQGPGEPSFGSRCSGAMRSLPRVSVLRYAPPCQISLRLFIRIAIVIVRK
jgi:hypothetical protein